MDATNTNKVGRRALFYGVCVWARLLLVVLAGFVAFHYPREAGLTAGILGALIFIGNIVQMNQTSKTNAFGTRNIWWSRVVHGMFALVACVAGFALAYKAVPWWTICVILFTNIIFGLISANRIKPFD